MLKSHLERQKTKKQKTTTTTIKKTTIIITNIEKVYEYDSESNHCGLHIKFCVEFIKIKS